MALDVHTEVQFNSSTDDTEYIFDVELDDELNGEDVSSFPPDTPAYIKVNKSANVDITDVVALEGSVAYYTSGSRSGNKEQLFATRDEKETGEFKLGIVPSTIDVSYRGRQGALTQQGSDIGEYVVVPNQSYTPFLATFTYSQSCRIYQFVPPPMSLEENETYNIYVVFYITVNEV